MGNTTIPTQSYRAMESGQSKSYIIPFALLCSLFFLWAVANNLNDILLPQFQQAFTLTNFQAGLIQSAFYFGYFIIPIPAGMLMKKFSYKAGILTGLFLYACGAALFWPAAEVMNYTLFLIGLFIIAAGLGCLETAANPFVTVLGPESGGHFRLNLAQTFNSFGAIIAVVFGQSLILSNVPHQPQEVLDKMTPEQLSAWKHSLVLSVQTPYMIIVAIVLLVALLILGIGTLRWHACTYYFDEVSIRSQSGILLRRGTEIPLERIASTVEEHPFYLRPLRAACLQISTAAGAVPEADMHLTLYLRDLHRLRQHIPVLQNGSTGAVAYHTPAWRMLLFSALFSSSFSGAIYIATICFQGGRITSDLVKQFQAQQILEDATDKASTAFHGVPRIAITIGIVILALWLISFGRNLLRYGRFRMRFGEEFISVHTGILTRRRYHLRDNAIIVPDLRQNLLMKIFGMVSLHIRCPGYGSRRDTLPVLIPLIRKKGSQALLEKLHTVPVMEHPKLHARSNIRFFWSFVWPPVIGLCAILPARFILLWLLPNLGAIIRFCSVMLIIPLVWLLCIRIVAMFTESVTMDDQYLQMHFCSWFTFHTITVNHARIVRTDLMQTPAQKMYGVCHLYITCNGPRQQRFKLTALPEAKARKIVETLARTEMQDMS